MDEQLPLISDGLKSSPEKEQPLLPSAKIPTPARPAHARTKRIARLLLVTLAAVVLTYSVTKGVIRGTKVVIRGVRSLRHDSEVSSWGFEEFEGGPSPQAGTPYPEDGVRVFCSTSSSSSFVHRESPAEQLEQLMEMQHELSPTTNVAEPAELCDFKNTKRFWFNRRKSLFFIARGPASKGSIHFKTAPPDSLGGGGAHAKVVSRYRSSWFFREVEVCHLRKPDGSEGVGIYTPENRWSSTSIDLDFDITVTLPHSLDLLGDRDIDIVSNMTHFAHYFDTLGNETHYYRTIEVQETDKPIHAEALYARNIRMTGDGAPITGSFHVGNELQLQTVDGDIQVEAYGQFDSNRCIRINMETWNGRIDAEISTASHGEIPMPHSALSLLAWTDNGPINVNIPALANGTSLKATVLASNADVYLALPSTYEGRVTSRAQTGRTRVLNMPTTEDPFSRGLHRTYEILHRDVGEQEGVVVWRPEARDETDTEDMSRAWVETGFGDSVITLL